MINKSLARLREYRKGMNVEDYLNTEFRQNLKDISPFLNPQSSVYTPEVVSTTNITTITSGYVMYFQYGSIVHVKGSYLILPTASGTSSFEITLPTNIPNVFSDINQAVGFTNAASVNNPRLGYVISQANKKTVLISFTVPATLENRTQIFDFSYKI